jgi:hypothetical protein
MGADANIPEKHGCTPAYVAAQSGSLLTLRVLVEELHADARTANKDGCTPLFVAAEEGFLDVVQYLVDQARVDVHKARDNGATVVQVAARNGHTDGTHIHTHAHTSTPTHPLHTPTTVVKFLIRRGADIFRPSLFGSALGIAQRHAQKGGTAGTFAFLKRKARCAEPACKRGAGFKKCSGCHVLYYCSRACQHKHWHQHQRECEIHILPAHQGGVLPSQ